MSPAYRRVLPSGDIIEVWRMLYNNRITITDAKNDGFTFREGYCYNDRERSLAAAAEWDGEDEPEGWNKNLQTGEWRP